MSNGRITIASVWLRRQCWSFDAFGPPSHRGPIGPLRHLLKEVVEALAAPRDISEYADCFLLVLDAADRAGFTLGDLLDAANSKLAINEQRKWPDWRNADPNIPLEHERSERSK